MVPGSCLCGKIRFEINEQNILLMVNCHCSNCRKVSGAEYGTFIQLRTDDFRWLAGEELVSTYESSPGNHRAFCKTCGSRMPQSNTSMPIITVPAGCLDADPGVAPQVNIFTASKVPWHSIDESILSFPGMGTPEFWSEFMTKVHTENKT